MVWLALRDRWLARLVMLFTLFIVALQAVGWAYFYLDQPWTMQAVSMLQGLLQYLLILWVVSQACRPLLDAVRTGAMELVLVTPVTPQQIVRAHWRALLRVFLIPVTVLFLLQLAAGLAASTGVRAGVIMMSAPAAFGIVQRLAVYLGSAISGLMGLAALAWFGMWMGLTTRKPTIAILKTICFCSILPGIVLGFAQVAIMIPISLSGAPLWLMSLVYPALHVAKDIVFIAWARMKLLKDFRPAVWRDARFPAAYVVPATTSSIPAPPFVKDLGTTRTEVS
jgi:hypothetical protein